MVGRGGVPSCICVSEGGIDYCIVGCDNFELTKNFIVTTMSESVEMGCKGWSSEFWTTPSGVGRC